MIHAVWFISSFMERKNRIDRDCILFGEQARISWQAVRAIDGSHNARSGGHVTDVIQLSQAAKDSERVERAIRYLDEHAGEQPGLSNLASFLDLSEHHLQRVFSRWAGISPKRFLQYLTKERGKELIRDHHSLLDVAYDIGLSSPSRLHDLFVSCEAVTPGDYRRRGEELEIRYGFHDSRFGPCILAVTEHGICWLVFRTSPDEAAAVAGLRSKWPGAELVRDQEVTGQAVAKAFADLDSQERGPLHLFVQGTNFQIKVWEALLTIPSGSVVSYGDIAETIGAPRASRAVGTAVGQNPISWLIPCHRVLRNTGVFGHYGGGPFRKRAILAWESAEKVLRTAASGDA